MTVLLTLESPTLVGVSTYGWFARKYHNVTPEAVLAPKVWGSTYKPHGNNP